MTDLVEFLRDRLDEDEQTARAAEAETSAVWTTYSESVDEDGGGAVAVGSYGYFGDQRHHIARHDPARVLAEVEAKRCILSQHLPVGTRPVCLSNCHTRAPGKSQTWPCLTLRLMALPYIDHEAYQEEWRPGPLLTVTGEDYRPDA